MFTCEVQTLVERDMKIKVKRINASIKDDVVAGIRGKGSGT